MKRTILLLFLLILCFNCLDTKTSIDSRNLGLSDFIKENFQAIEVDFIIEEIRKAKISESESKEL